MPYIKEVDRLELDLDTRHAANPGELNYLVTRLVRMYVEDHGLNYTTINDIVGAVEGAKAEFQRRVVAPYENAKVLGNGDVYPDAMTTWRVIMQQPDE